MAKKKTVAKKAAAKKAAVKAAARAATRATKKAAAKVKKKAPPKKAAPKAVAKAPVKAPARKEKKDRITWFDEAAHKPVIDQYAQRLDSFVQTMADGKVDAAEIEAQEKRLLKIMKEVEPMLDEDQHERVTQLLCELTAYDLMQMVHQMQEMRAKTVFQG